MAYTVPFAIDTCDHEQQLSALAKRALSHGLYAMEEVGGEKIVAVTEAVTDRIVLAGMGVKTPTLLLWGDGIETEVMFFKADDEIVEMLRGIR